MWISKERYERLNDRVDYLDRRLAKTMEERDAALAALANERHFPIGATVINPHHGNLPGIVRGYTKDKLVVEITRPPITRHHTAFGGYSETVASAPYTEQVTWGKAGCEIVTTT